VKKIWDRQINNRETKQIKNILENQTQNMEDSIKEGNKMTTLSKFSIPLAIIIAGILISAAVIYSNGGFSSQKAVLGGEEKQAVVDIKKVEVKNEPFTGDKNAPVTLAYWFDFQCPFCQRFDLNTLSALNEQYVKTGKLKVVFKDFQFLGPDSTSAGLAAHAVWEISPENYFKWHQAMFEKQDAENGGWGTKQDIIALTKTIPGIDANKVSQLMEEKKTEYGQEMDSDKTEADKFGISGTPGFIIGKQLIVGAQPISAFVQAIDDELKKR